MRKKRRKMKKIRMKSPLWGLLIFSRMVVGDEAPSTGMMLSSSSDRTSSSWLQRIQPREMLSLTSLRGQSETQLMMKSSSESSDSTSTRPFSRWACKLRMRTRETTVQRTRKKIMGKMGPRKQPMTTDHSPPSLPLSLLECNDKNTRDAYLL
jgi:hypothetical protein